MATTTQLIACGLGEDAVRYRIRAGRYTVVFRGVVSVISGGFPPLAREQAALLACGETAFLSAWRNRHLRRGSAMPASSPHACPARRRPSGAVFARPRSASARWSLSAGS
jgi:hypothetical protein